MCFTIDDKAPKPRTSEVYKVLRLLPNGVLTAPYYRDTTYRQGTPQVLSLKYQTWSYDRALEGLYVHSSLARGLAHLRQRARDRTDTCFVLVECTAEPEDLLFSSVFKEDDLPDRARTYRRLVVGRVLKATNIDVGPPQAVLRKLRDFKMPKQGA